MTRPGPSFTLLAYGSNQSCRLMGRAEHRVELISIGARGARVRLRAEAGRILRFGEDCRLAVGCALDRANGGEIPCVVAWMNGCEAGVEFSARMETSILALQRVLNRGQAFREVAA